MQQHNKTTGTRGIVSGWEEAVRFRDMITPQAEERARILTFWKTHGDRDTMTQERIAIKDIAVYLKEKLS